MAISRDQVDEIKSRVSIIDVAAERVSIAARFNHVVLLSVPSGKNTVMRIV